MKTCSNCNINLPLNAFYKKARSKDGRRACCKICTRLIDAPRRAKYYASNKDEILSKQKLAYENNKAEILDRQREYYKRNIDSKKIYDKAYRIRTEQVRREQQREYYENNKETIISRNREWHRINKERHRPVRTALAAKRRANQRNATPSWANLENIKSIYRASRELTLLTGIQFHVDHIYPLTSEIVCGLHVESNLQILPYYENLSKGNKILEDIV